MLQRKIIKNMMDSVSSSKDIRIALDPSKTPTHRIIENIKQCVEENTLIETLISKSGQKSEELDIIKIELS